MTLDGKSDSSITGKRQYKLFSDHDLIPLRPAAMTDNTETVTAISHPDGAAAHDSLDSEESDIKRGMRILESHRYEWERNDSGDAETAVPTRKIAVLFIVMIIFCLLIAIMYFISNAFYNFIPVNSRQAQPSVQTRN